MSDTRVTKNDLELISHLVFDSYITDDLEFQKIHFNFRTLKSEEREDITRRFRYSSNNENIKLIIEILSTVILYIEGQRLDKKILSNYLFKFNSKIIFRFYKFYQDLDLKASKASKFIDYFIESRESRNNWAIFKIHYKTSDPLFIKKFNQYQYYWELMNIFKDSLESEKKLWGKVEYATNSICAFVNPNAYRKSKNQIGIVEQLESQEDKEKQAIVEQLEQGLDGTVKETDDIFMTLNRLPNETDQEREIRVNQTLIKYLSGEIIDEHDRLVRENEIAMFKKYLHEKRKKILIQQTLRKKRGMKFEDEEVLDNAASRAAREKISKLGFFHDDVSYLDIARMKDFAAIPKNERLKIFEEVMKEEINVEADVEAFLNNLYKQNNKSDGHEQTEGQIPGGSIDNKTSDASVPLDSQRVISKGALIKNAAELARRMNVSVNSVDLLKQRNDKTQKIDKTLETRKQALEQLEEPKKDDENLDIIKFTKN